MTALALDDATNAAMAKAALHAAAGPWLDGDRVKRRIERAARLVDLGYSRASDIWYGKARAIRPAELARILAAARPPRPGADAPGTARVPEADLDRLRSLESEVAELRALLEAASRRMEGPAHD